MKNRWAILVFVGLALLSLGTVALHRPKADPKDLAYWLRAGADEDWSKAAAEGKPAAEFYVGLNLVRSNMLIIVDRIPRLSAVPIIGKRFFESRSYQIDNKVAPEQLAAAYGWIKKAADQGFAPAKEAEKLFARRVPGAPGNRLTAPVVPLQQSVPR